MTAMEGSLIARISEEAWRITEKLSTSVANVLPPAPLGRYAKELGIHCIRFEPLLSDGALAKAGKHLEIILNTDAQGVTYSAETTLFSADDGKWDALKAPIRFSVAHEIAHAVFLKVAEHKRQREFFQRNERAIENACNILARIFLLPKSMLIREIDNRLFDINHIRSLLSSFVISPEVFLRRLHLSDLTGQFNDTDGLLALMQDMGAYIKIKVCQIWGEHAIMLFQHSLQESKSKVWESERMSLSVYYRQANWALQGRKLNEIGLSKLKNIEHILKNKPSDQLGMYVEWAGGKVIPCKLSYHQIQERPRYWLLCIQVTGPIQKPGQGYLL